MLYTSYINFVFNEHNGCFDTHINEARRNLVHSAGIGYESILNRHSTEDEHTYKWRKDNFVPITNGAWERAVSALQRIFIDLSTSIDGSDSLLSFISGNNFNNTTFNQFIQQNVFRVMLSDPNAWVVLLPEPKFDEYGNAILNSQPYIKHFIVKSDDKIYSDEYCIIFEYNELYYIVTVDDYAVIEVTDEYKKEYKVLFQYTHGLGKIPFVITGGYYCYEIEGFKSFFYASVDIGNEVLRQFSDYQYIIASCGYPVKIVSPVECDQCDNGYIQSVVNEEVCSIKCGKCNGRHSYAPTSPSHILVREKKTRLISDDNNSTDLPMLEYVSPSTDIIDKSRESWEVLLDKMEYSLGLNTTDVSQSGVAKSIDREELYSMISAVSNNIYENIIHNLLYFIEFYINQQGFVQPIIKKPNTFVLKNSDVLYEELKKSITDNVPVIITNKIFLDYVSKRFSGDSVSLKKTQLQIMYDPIIYTDLEKIKLLLEKNVITNIYIYRNMFFQQALDKLLYEVGEDVFLSMDDNSITSYIDNYINIYINKNL